MRRETLDDDMRTMLMRYQDEIDDIWVRKGRRSDGNHLIDSVGNKQ
jgi:hypothetical protein